AIVVLAILGGIVAGVVFADFVLGIVLAFIGLGFFGLVMAGASSAMPVKTRHGTEMKAAWLAFKRYLENISKYTKLEEATDQFDKYLPYAIAFGLDRSWINTFTRVNTPIPYWYHPYWYGRGIGIPNGSPTSVGGGIGTPSVQGMSDSLAHSLQSMSTGLTTMLNSAASTFQSRPSSSGGGGGWSGGGFSGGGGGGGGSAGFG
ncbi:MAG TPA: hypothetical protein VJ508_00220, partial [Saprospiraceae bacterium]|nr:hypothetical protein [Saprospiraceae bacterium]